MKRGGKYAVCRCDRDALCKTVSAAGAQGGSQGTYPLTGYTPEQLARLEETDISYAEFFRKAPAMNPNRVRITGVVCGVRVEKIEDPLMREIRYLDKLVDELAKGKPLEKVLREDEG